MRILVLSAAWILIGAVGGMLSLAYEWKGLMLILPVSFIYGLGMGVLGDMVRK